MGEAKRRKRLDINWQKSVITTVEQSDLTSKWLCVAYILGKRTVISPHYKKDDAKAASSQVNARFNTIPREEWKRYINGSREPISKAIALLDYENDDEVLAIGRLNPDGSVTCDSSLEARQLMTKYVNKIAATSQGINRYSLPPTLYPQQEVVPIHTIEPDQMNAETRIYLDSIKKSS